MMRSVALGFMTLAACASGVDLQECIDLQNTQTANYQAAGCAAYPIVEGSEWTTAGELGHTIEYLGGGVYSVTEGAYFFLVIVSDSNEVILVDAPRGSFDFYPMFGLPGLSEVVAMITPHPVKYLVYSHYHHDHIGGAGALREAYPGLQIIASKPTAKLLKGFADPRRPLPDIIVKKEMELLLGNQSLTLVHRKSPHVPGNLYIHHQGIELVFASDMVWPQWAPAKNLGYAVSIPDILEVPTYILQRFPSVQIVNGGHLRVGSRADLLLQQEYLADLEAAARASWIVPATDPRFGEIVARTGVFDPSTPQFMNMWYVFSEFERVNEQNCMSMLAEKWGDKKLSGFHVLVAGHCHSVQMSIYAFDME